VVNLTPQVRQGIANLTEANASRRRPPRSCERCGRVFQPVPRATAKETRTGITHCSRACTVADVSEQRWVGKFSPLPFHRCVECGSEFYSRRKRSRCGGECEWVNRQRQAKAWWLAKAATEERHRTVTITCSECGKRVEYERFNNERDYCSRRCSKLAVKATRRARKKRATVGRVSRAKVYERDAWICRLCELPVERSKRAPDPESPSLDHIIPLSRGGEHSMMNVQLAHLRCNWTKSDRLAVG
jgi:5-methylcytosine-specific restriction endonuclease McrA